MGHDLLTLRGGGRIKRILYIAICHLSHFVAGCVTASMAIKYPLLAALLFASFIIYELSEDWKLSDGAYRDIFFYALGLYLESIFIAIN